MQVAVAIKGVINPITRLIIPVKGLISQQGMITGVITPVTGSSCQLGSVVTLKRVIMGVITPITGSSRQLESVIMVKRVITGVIMGVIFDHTVITDFFYWGGVRFRNAPRLSLLLGHNLS